MTRAQVNRIGMLAPVLCSIGAFGLVVGNMAAGTPPQQDEGAAAHIFQLLVLVQLPLGLIFLATVDWAKPLRVLLIVGAQAAALASAFAALWVSGY